MIATFTATSLCGILVAKPVAELTIKASQDFVLGRWIGCIERFRHSVEPNVVPNDVRRRRIVRFASKSIAPFNTIKNRSFVNRRPQSASTKTGWIYLFVRVFVKPGTAQISLGIKREIVGITHNVKPTILTGIGGSQLLDYRP